MSLGKFKRAREKEMLETLQTQSERIAELEADNKRLKAKVFASFNKPLKEQE